MAWARLAGSPDYQKESELLFAQQLEGSLHGKCQSQQRLDEIKLKLLYQLKKEYYLRHILAASLTRRPLHKLKRWIDQKTNYSEANTLPGVAIPPAAKLTTGSLFSLAVSFNKWNGAWISFA